MKNDGISQSESRKIQLDEAKVCQLMAVLAEMWPDLGASKPDLRVVPSKPNAGISDLCNDRGAVDRANQLLRENLPEEFKREIGIYEFARSSDGSHAGASAFVEPAVAEAGVDRTSPSVELGRVVRKINRKAPRDQLKVLLHEARGSVQDEPPKLKVNREMVDRLKAMIRSTWPHEFGAGKKVVQFPRAKKRGAKKRSGPCADIVAFRCGRSDFSNNERAVFDTFAKTQGARYAVAVVEYFRLPLDEGSRFCRLGMTPAEFLRSLDNKRI